MAKVDEYAFARETLKRLVCELIDSRPVTYEVVAKPHPEGVVITEEVTPEEMKEIIKRNEEKTGLKYGR